jgi:predicted glycoside hydrolase/deacetylase ChbG (UPF0249 family)
VPGGRRRIWLCADDYGISRSVNAAIRELIARGRINATSVMTAGPHLDRGDAASLATLNSGTKRAALGLHVTLTAPFKPLSEGFAPLYAGGFPTLNAMMLLSALHRLRRESLENEITAQVRAFVTAFGRPPDFVDGHQHVHLFPQVRDAVLKVMAQLAPGAWVRQCGRPRGAARPLSLKELAIDAFNLGFRHKASQRGIATNPAFAGAYDFRRGPDFSETFPRFLAGLPDGGLIMCHPGFVDAELKRLDSFTHQREKEFAYFNSEEFPKLLADRDAELARPSGP